MFTYDNFGGKFACHHHFCNLSFFFFFFTSFFFFFLMSELGELLASALEMPQPGAEARLGRVTPVLPGLAGLHQKGRIGPGRKREEKELKKKKKKGGEKK